MPSPGDIKGSLSRQAYRLAAGTLGALGLKAAFRTYVLPRLLSAAQSGEAARDSDAAMAKYIEDEISRIVAMPGKILVGPWLSEVGFEMLYWIPMLRWMKQKWQIPEERLIVVSRGGTALWYEGLCGRYVDILDLVSAERFAELNRTRWERDQRQKQAFIEEQDREVIGWVRDAAAFRGDAVIHPSLMYNLFWSYFRGRARLPELLERARFAPLQRADLTDGLKAALPEDYVAMRFYFRPSLPDSEKTRRFVASITARVAKHHPVVLLNNGMQLDDHADCPVDNAIMLSDQMSPSTNLDIQSRVIANARAFVGTYGGLSYLPPFFGVPSISFYSDDQDLMPVHLRTAQAACRELGARVVSLHTDDMAALDGVLGPPGPARPPAGGS